MRAYLFDPKKIFDAKQQQKEYGRKVKLKDQ